MPRYHISDSAKRDIAGIKNFTVEHWGKAKAREYAEGLRAKFRQLAERPQIGRLRAEIQTGLRSLLAMSHVIYYEVRNMDVYIVRVLHKSQDPVLQFPSQP